MPVVNCLTPWKQALWLSLMHAGNSMMPLVERLSFVIGLRSMQDDEYQDLIARMAWE